MAMFAAFPPTDELYDVYREPDEFFPAFGLEVSAQPILEANGMFDDCIAPKDGGDSDAETRKERREREKMEAQEEPPHRRRRPPKPPPKPFLHDASREEFVKALRTPELTYWRRIRLVGKEWKSFEVWQPSGWWVLLEPKEEVLQWLVGKVRNPDRFFREVMMTGSKPLPYPLATMVIESGMPHHTSQERWPRAVPLKLLEDVVRPASIEILDPPEVEQHRREIYALDIWSGFANSCTSERKWYETEPRYLRSRPVLDQNHGWKMVPDHEATAVPQVEWMPWLFKAGSPFRNWRFMTHAKCYPCLVAGRHCIGRRKHKTKALFACCRACKRHKLSFRQCAVPEQRSKLECPPTKEWLFDARKVEDFFACHICGRMGPWIDYTECVKCHIWVCNRISCEKFARVQAHVDYWYCCHCLGIPLQCMCPEGPKEAAKVLLNSEVALLPKGLHHQGPLLATVKQADTPEMLRTMRDKEKPIELVGGLQQYELEATFIEDAATLRKFTYPEFAQLRMQLIDLRKKLQHETDEKKQFVLMHWLYNVQKFATPDLVLTFLMQVHYVVEKRMMFDHADKILKWHRCVPTQLQAFIGGWPMRGGNKAIPPVTRQKFTKKEEIKVDKKSRKWGAARWRLLKDAMTRPRRFLNFLKRKYCPDDSGDEFDEDDTYNDVEVQMILEFFKQFGLGYSDLPDVNTFAPELRGLLASRPKKPKGQGKQFEGNRRNNLKRDKEKEKKKKKLFANPLWDEEEEKKKAEAAAAADQLVPLLVPED